MSEVLWLCNYYGLSCFICNDSQNDEYWILVGDTDNRITLINEHISQLSTEKSDEFCEKITEYSSKRRGNER